MSISEHEPNQRLQAKLREMVDVQGLTAVSRRLDIGREALARYLANIPLHTSTFRGIEATLAAIETPVTKAEG